MHKLIEYVCDELKELEKKADKSGNLSLSEIEYADKLAHLKKNLLKGEELYDEMETGEYSGAMRDGSYARRGGENYESNGMSRARGGRRGGRTGANQYGSYRGYSRDSGDMIEKLEELVDEAPDESSRKEIHRLIEKMRNM